MGRSREGSFLGNVVNECPLTWFIAALNVGIFVLAWVRSGAAGASVETEVLLKLGASMRIFVQLGAEWWRLLTAVFLHANWLHLLFNVTFMFSWCAAIEKSVGSGWFAFAYLTTGIGGFAVSVLGKEGPSVGASGAGYGMLAVALALLYRREGSWDRFTANPFVRQVVISSVFWTLLTLATVSRLDHYAHAGGFVLGAACGLVLGRRRGRDEVKWMLSLAAYILVWVGVVVAACIPGVGLGTREFGG